MNRASLQEDSPVHVLAYLSYSDLFPKVKPSIWELQSRLKDFDFFETILILSKINLLFSDIKRPFDPSLQIYIARWFFNDYTLERLKKKWDANTLLFHRHQLLFMLKNAFLTCQMGSNRPFRIRQVRNKLGICFLIANDLLSLLKLDEEALNRKDPDKIKELLWKESLPGWELNNPPNLMLVISRMRKIFKEISAQFKDDDCFLDLNDIFKSATELTIDEFMFFIFGLLSIYLENNKRIIKDPNAIYIHKDGLLAKARKQFPGEKLCTFLKLVSLPLSAYREQIRAAKDLNYNYGFLPFRKYPIVHLDQGIYFCIDFYFLLEKIASGIFWTINEYLQSGQRERFHLFWGMLFEGYITMLIKESLNSEKGNFYSRPRYQKTKNEIADGILILGEDMVLFEFKFSILSQEAKFENSIDSLIEEIKAKFERNKRGEWKGYGQLANNINKLFSKSSQFACNEIDKEKIKGVFPVLIVYEDVLQTPFTNYYFNRNFQKILNRASLMDNIEIYPLTLMTIEDFEKSLPFLMNLPGLIKKRILFDPSLDFSFSHFLKLKFSKEHVIIPDIIHSEYREFSEEIRGYFFYN